MHTWKPLDEELVLRAAAETGCIVTAENHQVGTGLGSAITNLTSAKNPVPVERIGIQNRFGQVGPQDFLMQQYNLTAEDIAAGSSACHCPQAGIITEKLPLERLIGSWRELFCAQQRNTR